MDRTVNTLVSTPTYPGRLAFAGCGSSGPVIHIRTDGDLADISVTWLVPTVQLTFPHGTHIPDSDLELKGALEVEKRVTSDGFVIRSAALDEEAFGLTERDVRVDFLTSLRDRYVSLSRRESSLSSHDSSILDKLRNLLGPKQG